MNVEEMFVEVSKNDGSGPEPDNPDYEVLADIGDAIIPVTGVRWDHDEGKIILEFE